MAGGALLFGGFRRVLRDFRPRDSFLMGLGMLILANSRPYEGFVLTSGTLLMLAVWALSRQGPPGLLFTKRVGIPLVISGLMIGVEIGWYNYSVTGNPLQMPYMVHEATY